MLGSHLVRIENPFQDFAEFEWQGSCLADFPQNCHQILTTLSVLLTLHLDTNTTIFFEV